VEKLVYIYFSGKDYRDILKDKLRDFRITIEKKGEVEILARSEHGVIGKIGDIEFVVTRGLDPPADEVIKRTEVVFESLSDDFEEFALGKVRFTKDRILVDCKFDEEFFYLIFPLLDFHLTRARTLIDGGNSTAENLIEKSRNISKRLTELSELIKTSKSVEELEDIISELSSIQADVFSRLLRFRAFNEEVMKSITASERVAKTFFQETRSILLEIGGLRDRLEYFKYVESTLENVLEGVKSVLNLVKMRLDVLRNREFSEIQRSLNDASIQNVRIQKRTSALQASAVVIEFVAVFYYTLRSWEHFMGETLVRTPAGIKLITLVTFTAAVVYCTEALAEAMEEKRLLKRTVLAALLVLLSSVFLYIVPVTFS